MSIFDEELDRKVAEGRIARTFPYVDVHGTRPALDRMRVHEDESVPVGELHVKQNGVIVARITGLAP